jgi:tryptophan aminotransferase
MATHEDGVPIVQTPPAIHPHASVSALPSNYYADFLSDLAKTRKPSPSSFTSRNFPAVSNSLCRLVRGLLPLEATPGMISLLAGKPHPATFPISSLTFSVRSPGISIDAPGPETTVELPSEHLAAGLQYGPTSGFAPLIKWAQGLQEYEHGRNSGEGWRVSMGNGSQDLIYKVGAVILHLMHLTQYHTIRRLTL